MPQFNLSYIFEPVWHWEFLHTGTIFEMRKIPQCKSSQVKNFVNVPSRQFELWKAVFGGVKHANSRDKNNRTTEDMDNLV